MKRIMGLIVVFVFMLSTAALAQDLTAADNTKTVHLSAYLGGGSGGIGDDNNNRYSYAYGGMDAVYTPKELKGFGFLGRAQYFLNSASEGTKIPTGALDGGVSTGRVQAGLVYMKYDKESGWWIYSATAGGWDFEERSGDNSGAVVSEDLSIGHGSFSNEVNSTFKLGDSEHQSDWIRDRMYFRVTKWLAVGPQISYVWFQQWNDKDQALRMVYEPSFGGQLKFTEAKPDPRCGLILNGSNGDWLGTAWGVDLYYRF